MVSLRIRFANDELNYLMPLDSLVYSSSWPHKMFLFLAFLCVSECSSDSDNCQVSKIIMHQQIMLGARKIGRHKLFILRLVTRLVYCSIYINCYDGC